MYFANKFISRARNNLQEFEFRLPPRLKQRTMTGVVEQANGKPAIAFFALLALKDNKFQNNVDLANGKMMKR